MRETSLLDLRAEGFGRWTVVRRVGGMRWECRCECGTVRAVLQRSLRNGQSQSCGCARTKHGHSSKRLRTPTYWSWSSMVARCFCPSASDYARYGGKGITVCDRWRNSFQNFLDDMGERPAGKTLDRIDGDGDYRKSNCRWATPLEQQLNRKATRKTRLGGEIVSIDGAAKRLGIARSVVEARVGEHGDPARPHKTERLCRHRRAA